MPNDMAKRGWRTVAQIGSSTEACTCSHHEIRGCGARAVTRRRWVSTPVVDARIFVTRLAGGSTSVRPFSQLRPASASAKQRTARPAYPGVGLEAVESGPGQDAVNGVREQRARTRCTAFRYWCWSGITSPAYRYVVGAWQVPPALYLFSISRYPPEPSKRSQFRDNPYPVSPLESLLPEALAIAWPRPRARSLQPPGCGPGRPGERIGPEFAR